MSRQHSNISPNIDSTHTDSDSEYEEQPSRKRQKVSTQKKKPRNSRNRKDNKEEKEEEEEEEEEEQQSAKWSNKRKCNIEQAQHLLNSIGLSHTGARVGDRIIGVHNITSKAVMEICESPISPIKSDLDTFREFPSVWDQFLEKLVSIPFFADMPNKQARTDWLVANQTVSGRFIGDPDRQDNNNNNNDNDNDNDDEENVSDDNDDHDQNNNNNNNNNNNKKKTKLKVLTAGASNLNLLDPEVLDQLLQDGAMYTPQYIETLFPRKGESQTKHPSLLMIRRLWKLAPAIETVTSIPFSGLVISLHSGEYRQVQNALPEGSSPHTWYVSSIGEDEHRQSVVLAAETTSRHNTPAWSTRESFITFLTDMLRSLQITYTNDIIIIMIQQCLDVIATFTPGALKSLLQKLIRFRATCVALNRTGSIVVDARVALVVSVCSLARHPGSFVPELRTFVSGLTSVTKRLAVICFEDACPYGDGDGDGNGNVSYRHTQMVQLLAAGLLSSTVRSWLPSTHLLQSWCQIALDALTSATAWNWDIPRGSKLKPFSLATITPLQLNQPLVMCSLLLDELRSFDGDESMVRDIAVQTMNRSQLFHRVIHDSQMLMPLCHCVDHHFAPDVIFYFPPTLVEQYASSDTAKYCFANFISELWKRCSSINPRRPGRYGSTDRIFTRGVEGYTYTSQLIESDPFIQATREAQWQYLAVTSGDLKNVTNINENAHANANPPSASSYPVSYSLSDQWLTAMTGTIPIKLGAIPVRVCISISDIFNLVAFRKPGRETKNQPPLTDEQREKAIDLARDMLTQHGIVMNAVAAAPIPQLANKRLFLRPNPESHDEQEYVIVPKESSNPYSANAVTWDSLKHGTISFPHHPARPMEELTVQNALSYVHSGTVQQDADALLRELLSTTKFETIYRVMAYLRGFPSQIEFNRLSRSGGGLTYSVSVQDVGAFHFLCKLSVIYPAALMHHPSKLITFEVKNGPLLWKLRDQLMTFVNTTLLQQTTTTTTEEKQDHTNTVWNTSWFRDTKQRVLKPYQALAMQDMINNSDVYNQTHEFVQMRVGSGKTLMVLLKMQHLIGKGPGHMPKHVLYATPKESIAHLIDEFHHFNLKVHVIIPTKNWKSKQKAYPGADSVSNTSTLKPYCINLIEHDDIRVVYNDITRISAELFFVLDEAHKAFNETSHRTNGSLTIARFARNMVVMTGTVVLDSKLLKLASWLKMCVSCSVTDQNFWALARCMINHDVDYGIEMERVDRELSFDMLPGSYEAYRKLMPVSLGGHNQRSSPQTFNQGCDLCWDVCDVEIVRLSHEIIFETKSDCGVMIVSRNHAHSAAICQKILAKNRLKQQDIYVLTQGSFKLTDEMVERGVMPDYKVVIVPMSKNTGYEVTRFHTMISSVYKSNQASRTQIEARITREGQKAKTCVYYTINCGVLTRILQRQNDARSLASIFAELARQ